MGRRKIGWEDESVSTSRGSAAHKEKQYRGKKGERHVIRVMGDAEEFRVHFVDDVLDPDENGEPRGFNMICAREWDDDEEDWVGDCVGCDREYSINTKYIAGILHVGTYKGRSKNVQKVDPENATLYWDFGADKYRQLSDIALELGRADPPKTLKQVEITVKCEKEDFQDLTLNVSQAKSLTTKDHLRVYKEEGEKLVEEASKAPSKSEQQRMVKKRKPRRTRDDDDDGEESEKPRKPRHSKGSSKPKKKAKEPEPEEDDFDDDGDGGEDLDAILDDLDLG